MDRTIIHIDLDAFFCAVEEQRDPSLRGKPFAVGGRPETRGVVASCSYPARRFGVHSAMPMAQALRVCPGLLVVPGNHRHYRAVSRQVMAQLRAVTERVEQISIDEAFLDVTELVHEDLELSGEELARQIQQRIHRELGLPCSLGVASNKLVAKIANNVGKAAASGDGPPNAVLAVVSGKEATFLAPLPCEALWGVGPKTAERLQTLGIRTIGELAQYPADDLARRFGKHGSDLARRARGIDTRPVQVHHEPKSVSQETTFPRDVDDVTVLRQTLRELSAGVGRQLRKKRMTGTTVKLKLRWPDFETPTRQITLEQPTDDPERIYTVAEQLFERLWAPGRPIRLLGVGVSGLGAPPRQMSLWDKPDEKAERLADAVARLRARFGQGVVKRGSEMADEDTPDGETLDDLDWFA